MAIILNKSARGEKEEHSYNTDHDYMNMEVDDHDDDEKPALPDVKLERPDKKFKQLVIDAIRSSDNQMLTAEGVCLSIQETYPFYKMRAATKESWQFQMTVKKNLIDGTVFCKVNGTDADPMFTLKKEKEEFDDCPTEEDSSNPAIQEMPTYAVDNGMYICSQCEVKMSSEHKIRRHIVTHVFGGIYKEWIQCETCDFKTKLEEKFAAHKANWCNPVKCDSCEFKTKNKQRMENHVKSKHTDKEKSGKEKTIMCEHCTKMFGSVTRLEQHVQNVHLGIKRFFCKENGCDYSTYQGKDLKFHMQMHTGQMTYHCEVSNFLSIVFYVTLS